MRVCKIHGYSFSGDLQSTTDHLRELNNQLAGCKEELNSTSQEAGLRVSSLTQQVEVIRGLTESALEASGSALQVRNKVIVESLP